MDDNELGRLVREALAHNLTPAVSAVTVRGLWEAWRAAHVYLAALATENSTGSTA